MRIPNALVAALALTLVPGFGPTAARAEVDPADLARIEILPGWETPAGTRMAAVRITLAPGWKTYWRAPGAAGIPPLFDWQGSQNIAGAAFHWPVPHVFDQAGLRSIGYTDQVVIPLEITHSDGGPTRIAGSVQIGVCQQICVPVELHFDSLLPPDGHRDPAIVAALVDRPMTAEEAGVTAVTCSAAPSAEGLRLTARVQVPASGADEMVVIETDDPALWVSEAATRREGGWLEAEAEVLARDGGGVTLDRAGLRFTLLGAGAAVDIRGCDAG